VDDLGVVNVFLGQEIEKQMGVFLEASSGLNR
jgi:hypothetical protein